jgi:hypothetical protein
MDFIVWMILGSLILLVAVKVLRVKLESSSHRPGLNQSGKEYSR